MASGAGWRQWLGGTMSSSTLKRTVVVAMCMGVLGGVGVTSAYAGEITGTGRTLEVVPTPGPDAVLHGNSECAYSGLNDDYYAPTPNNTSAPRVQTPKGAKQFVGIACRGGGSAPEYPVTSRSPAAAVPQPKRRATAAVRPVSNRRVARRRPPAAAARGLRNTGAVTPAPQRSGDPRARPRRYLVRRHRRRLRPR